MSDLAIVIPAYKVDFLEATLESIANQSRKEFVLYVGDDCSPYDVSSLVDKYSHKFNVVYHRFEDNLGGKDLVAQWERCIALTQGEKWIWLFSDDDIMSPDCVERFYNEVSGNRESYDVYHFNVNVIDSFGHEVRKTKRFPEIIKSEELYRQKESARIDSFVVEYIFSRKAFSSIGGFVKFDMAWGSDTATWVMLGGGKGIKTISNATVGWRQSGCNITPDVSNDMVQRKLLLEIDYLKWAASYFSSDSISSYNKYLLFRKVFHYSGILTDPQMQLSLRHAYDSHIIGSLLYRVMSCGVRAIRFAKKLKSSFL